MRCGAIGVVAVLCVPPAVREAVAMRLYSMWETQQCIFHSVRGRLFVCRGRVPKEFNVE